MNNMVEQRGYPYNQRSCALNSGSTSPVIKRRPVYKRNNYSIWNYFSKREKRLIKVLVATIIILGSYMTIYSIQQFRYKVDVFDCSEMSVETHNWLEKLGIHTEIVHGWNWYGLPKGFVGHAWVRLKDLPYIGDIDFDPTTVAIVDYSDDYQEIYVYEGPGDIE